MKSENSVVLPSGRSVGVLRLFPEMNVAVVMMAGGRLRTVKLSEFQGVQGPPPRATVPHVPDMGHGMTSDSPAVRRIKAEARPVRGQEPTVKVKQEPPAIQAALTQPPAPVPPEEAARIGQRDSQSGRTVLQPSNNLIQNERLANQAAPDLETRLSHITKSVPGAKLDRLRPQKGLERLQAKVEDGKPPRTISDNLAAQIVAPNVEAKDQLIAGMKQEFPVISVDDKFTQPRDKAGYPSANVQVQMPNGGTAEVQIVTPEVQAKTDQTHRLYTLGRSFPEGSAERARYWDQAAAIHAQALEKFRARKARESLSRSRQAATGVQQPGALARGQRVVLKNGQTGKIVGFADKTGRIIVRTSKGLKTVRPGEIRGQIQPGTRPSARLATRVPSEKAQQLLETFVRLTPEGVLNTASRVESAIEQGHERLPDVVWVNQPVMHLLWHWKLTKGLRVTGLAADVDSAKELATVFEGIAHELNRSGKVNEANAAIELTRHLRDVAEKDNGVAIVMRTGDSEYDSFTAREERGHILQERIGSGNIHKHANLAKLWLEPEFKKTSAALVKEGYPNNPPSLVMEASIKLLLGQGDSLGLNEAEQVSAIRKYLQSIVYLNGLNAAEDLKLVAEPRYHKIFQEVNNDARSSRTETGK